MSDATILLLICALPACGAVLMGALTDKGTLARTTALFTMLAVLALTGVLFNNYTGAATAVQPALDIPWIDSLGIRFHLAVDGLNLYLLLLTALLFPVVVLCTWNSPATRSPLFLALILLLETGLVGTFLSQNLMLFFICWEAVLIPMVLLILVFGAEKSRQAAQVFFLYTMAGSVLLLAAVILLGMASWQQTGAWSFELETLLALQLNWGTQLFVFVAIVLACAIKCPLFPFHSWLPLAYMEAPPAGTALMAGALSKMGAFALLKLAVPLSPQVASAAAPFLVALAVFSILYGAILALRQTHYKRLVAYSSLSHMGYIVLGIFCFQETALHGALFQMLSHGLAVAGLFLFLGMLEERQGADYLSLTGLSSTAPRLAVVMMLLILTSVALPLTSGFTSEFLVLFGAFRRGLTLYLEGAGSLILVSAVIACSGMVLGAGYMLRFARTLLFGKASDGDSPAELSCREALAFFPVLLLILWVGVNPASMMKKAQSDVTTVTARTGVPAQPSLAALIPTQNNGGAHGN